MTNIPDYKIIDNALPIKDFKTLEKNIMSNTQTWNYSEGVILGDVTKDNGDIYFMHLYYLGVSDTPHIEANGKALPPKKSKHYSDILPVLKLLNKVTGMENLLRVKANLYYRTEKLNYHSKHSDFSFSHKGAILSINTNDGCTVLEDGTEIKSVSNRLLLFDPSQQHSSTSCTNQKRRVNINFNYI